ncbi:hypothetical protein GcM3_012043 [Golovinomyces cichoracearum]|uniref:Uncharacterized protein n=1 Tax=Golovinomyces cichoracearum TaxID=62708 RepID=A0A420J9N1_9PEZI|nr:hypothetical protein GcM3_012043 [Golovinomyces cichoracearum]
MESEQKIEIHQTMKERNCSKGINLKNDTDNDVGEFLRNRIEKYRIAEHQGDTSWWDNYDGFKEFTKPEDFLRAGTELPRKMRGILRSRAGNLIALINFDEPPEWPDSDKDYKQIFEGPEYQRSLLIKWKKLTFKSIKQDEKNIGKTLTDFFKSVCKRPAVTLNGLLSDLRSAAEFHDRIIDKDSASQTLFIDRKYHKHSKNANSTYLDARNSYA